MSKVINRRLIDDYTDKNNPNGLAKLALASGVSVSTIEKARLGKAPKKSATRRKIAEALGVRETDLFPVAHAKRSSRAS